MLGGKLSDERLRCVTGHASEALGNIRTVKALCTEGIEEDKYNDANDNALKKGIKVLISNTLGHILIALVLTCTCRIPG